MLARMVHAEAYGAGPMKGSRGAGGACRGTKGPLFVEAAVWRDPQLRILEPAGSGARSCSLIGLATRLSLMTVSTRFSAGKNWTPIEISKGKTVTLFAPAT
jgi:hypothetical protein